MPGIGGAAGREAELERSNDAGGLLLDQIGVSGTPVLVNAAQGATMKQSAPDPSKP